MEHDSEGYFDSYSGATDAANDVVAVERRFAGTVVTLLHTNVAEVEV